MKQDLRIVDLGTNLIESTLFKQQEQQKRLYHILYIITILIAFFV